MCYLVQQEESCPTTGRIHWQGFVVFERKLRLGGCKVLLPSAHWEPMQGSVDEAADYCCDPTKRADNGLLLEDGFRPLYGDAARGESTKDRYKRAYSLAIQGEFSAIEPSMMLRHLGNILKLNVMFGPKPPAILRVEPPGVWLHGAAGAGKTTFVQKWPHYSKDPRHRWFDGYNKEKMVVLDDVAPFHVAQTDIFKQLGHHFAFQGETKGGAMWLRPSCVVITSQYTPCDCWEKDESSQAAIVRRYKQFIIPRDIQAAEVYISRLYSYCPPIAPGCTEEDASLREESLSVGQPGALGVLSDAAEEPDLESSQPSS